MLTGSVAERALVAEHLHAVDQIADAIGLRADELRQRAVLVLEAGLQQLRGAADARQRVLDLVRQHRGHARHRARGGAMGELALDHLRHRALLQHQHDQARLVGHAPAEHVDQAVHAAARQADVDAVLVDGGAGAPHLADQRAERAREGDDVGQRLALQHAVAEREEGLGRARWHRARGRRRRAPGWDAAAPRAADRTRCAGAGQDAPARSRAASAALMRHPPPARPTLSAACA